ncbi:MAG: hypothetical protein IH831_00775 [Planctomycetes bacterium]|nr:hypothetical protein [Planctomycetota bacterium]
MAVLGFVTIVCLVMGWMYRPHTYVAESNLQIKYWLTGDASDRQYDIFCKTQQTLMKTDFVINAALSRKKIARLACVSNREDPLKWLLDELEVTFPGDSDIMKVALSGGEASMPEYCQLIDAIVNSYTNEVFFKERVRREEVREAEEATARRIRKELGEKIDSLETLLAAHGSDQSSETAEVLLLRAEVKTLTDAWTELQSHMLREQIDDKALESHIRLLQPATASKQ